MNNEQIIICLEQKAILLTKIMDLTKQIEVRCRQQEIRLDTFLEQRAVYMQRVDKCDALLRSLVETLEQDERQKLKAALEDPAHAQSDSDSGMARALSLIRECNTLVHQAIAIDLSARELLQAQYASMREKLNAARKEDASPSMFHS